MSQVSYPLYSHIYIAGSDPTPYFWVSAINSSTQAQLSTIQPPAGGGNPYVNNHVTTTAVTNARCGIGLPCMDGQHPSPQLAALMATCVPVAALAAT